MEDNFLDMYSFLKIPFFDALAIIELTLLKDFWISLSFFASTEDLNLFRAVRNLDKYWELTAFLVLFCLDLFLEDT